MSGGRVGSRHAGVATVHKAGVIDRHFSPLTVLCVMAPDLFRHAILSARVCARVRACVLRRAPSLRAPATRTHAGDESMRYHVISIPGA